jgi:Domain of unknown function (DUF4426)
MPGVLPTHRRSVSLDGTVWLVAMVAAGMLAGCGGGAPPAPPPAHAWTDDGQVAAGPYTLSYQAQPLMDLAPTVAQRYGLDRRPGRGLLTLVLNRQPGGTAAEATYSVEVRSLTGALRETNLRRVEEAGAVSHLAEFPTTGREWLVFHVTAELPEGKRLEATFRREFFAD